MEGEGRVRGWKDNGKPHCWVCGNQQFSILELTKDREKAEMAICDCCRMSYLIGRKEEEENTAAILGFMEHKNYFEMLINGGICETIHFRRP